MYILILDETKSNTREMKKYSCRKTVKHGSSQCVLSEVCVNALWTCILVCLCVCYNNDEN